jgi:hypothetical protein
MKTLARREASAGVFERRREVIVDRRFAGMTVNERLFAANRLAAWDAAVRDGDRADMIRILEGVALDAGEAARIADQVLADPGRYGF